MTEQNIEQGISAGIISDSIQPRAASIQILALLDGLQLQWLLSPDLDTTAALRTASAAILPLASRRRLSRWIEPIGLPGVTEVCELLEVEQLTAGHDEVADGQQRGGPAARPDDDILSSRRVPPPAGHEDVGHDGAHDPSGQLLAGVDREDPPACRPPAG